MKKALRYGGGIVALLLAYLFVWPSQIDAVSWNPPVSKGMTGAFSLNDKLKTAEILSLSDGYGPEDVAVDSAGRIYGGLQDGRIIRLNADGSEQETFVTIGGGRPLGLAFDAAGNLIVADAWKGLLSVSPEGAVTVLTTGHGGRPFKFADDLDIGSDGKIYFSDASDTYSQPDYTFDLMEARGHGRLMVFDPATSGTKMLLDGLYFANGIALSQNEDFVLVNETGRYRVTRYWLKGAKAGQRDVFIDNLPGFPDGISSNGKGVFWLAIPSPRSPQLDQAHPSVWLKNLLSKLPKALSPKAIRHGTVVALNEQGKVLHTLHDPDGANVYMVTSVEQVGDLIYLGSLEAPQIVRLKAPVG
ncbi:MAG: SMP-30/gluconolactonase/LRE family protein [Kordiimonadaceae bacterium]|nr:SMP-30/gluconolactonase/LRE family protein [Kordiimonadaceae bacterium]